MTDPTTQAAVERSRKAIANAKRQHYTGALVDVADLETLLSASPPAAPSLPAEPPEQIPEQELIKKLAWEIVSARGGIPHKVHRGGSEEWESWIIPAQGVLSVFRRYSALPADVVKALKALDEVKPACVLGCEGVCGKRYENEELCCIARVALAPFADRVAGEEEADHAS